MKNALRRLGLSASEAAEALAASGLSARVRAEEIDLEGFGRLTSRPAVQRVLGLAGGVQPSHG